MSLMRLTLDKWFSVRGPFWSRNEKELRLAAWLCLGSSYRSYPTIFEIFLYSLKLSFVSFCCLNCHTSSQKYRKRIWLTSSSSAGWRKARAWFFLSEALHAFQEIAALCRVKASPFSCSAYVSSTQWMGVTDSDSLLGVFLSRLIRFTTSLTFQTVPSTFIIYLTI